ncbi:MAG: glutaminase [Elainella sp.]
MPGSLMPSSPIPPLATLTQPELARWVELARSQADPGSVLDRISWLASADPNWFAVQVQSPTHQVCSGETDRPVALMSLVKPFLLLAVLHHYGSTAAWVDCQPSQLPFNSLAQLQADGGRPRNAMINSGAITLADKLPGATANERCRIFCDWLNQQAGAALQLDQALREAVRQSDRSANLALLAELNRVGLVEQPELALDTYEQICCLTGKVQDLAHLGLLLALGSGQEVILAHRQAVNAMLLTCGLYEASSSAAARIGLPVKSAVSGAILAIVPRQGAIACYGPALDAVGNSVIGLKLIELLSAGLSLNLFG